MTNHTEQTAALDWSKINAAIKEYIEDYELNGEDEGGADACHTPTDFERFMLEDAINGLMADGAFLATLTLPAAASSSTEPVAKVRAILERMNRKGGLGHDVHGWVNDALDELDKAAAEAVPPASSAPAGLPWHLPVSVWTESERSALKAAPHTEEPAGGSAPAGFKLVPIEPTDEMVIAAENDYEQAHSHFPDWKRAYRAMVAAAPHTEEPAGGEAQSAALVAREACFDVPAGLSDAQIALERIADLGYDRNVGEAIRIARAALAASSAPPESQDAADAQKGGV